MRFASFTRRGVHQADDRSEEPEASTSTRNSRPTLAASLLVATPQSTSSSKTGTTLQEPRFPSATTPVSNTSALAQDFLARAAQSSDDYVGGVSIGDTAVFDDNSKSQASASSQTTIQDTLSLSDYTPTLKRTTGASGSQTPAGRSEVQRNRKATTSDNDGYQLTPSQVAGAAERSLLDYFPMHTSTKGATASQSTTKASETKGKGKAAASFDDCHHQSLSMTKGHCRTNHRPGSGARAHLLLPRQGESKRQENERLLLLLSLSRCRKLLWMTKVQHRTLCGQQSVQGAHPDLRLPWGDPS